MFCSGCNTRNSTNNKFCRHCGKPLTEAKSGAGLAQPHAGGQTLSQDSANGAEPSSATSVPSDDVDELLRQAYDARNRGALTEAIALARKAVSMEPDDVRCYSLLGNLCESAELYEDAIAAYGRAVELAPEDKVDRYRLSVIRDRQTPVDRSAPVASTEMSSPSESRLDDEAASVSLSEPRERRAFRRLAPLAAAVLVFGASIVGGAHFVLKAKPPAPGALASATAPGEMHITRGKFHFERGDYADAASQFILALADSPDDPEAAYWLTETQIQQSAQYQPEAGLATASELPMPAEDEGALMGPIEGVPADGSSGIPHAVGAELAEQGSQPTTTPAQAGPLQSQSSTPMPQAAGPTGAAGNPLLSQAGAGAATAVPELFGSLADSGGASRRPRTSAAQSHGPSARPAASISSPTGRGPAVSLADEGSAASDAALPSDLDSIIGGPRAQRQGASRQRSTQVRNMQFGSSGSAVRLAPEGGTPPASVAGASSGDSQLMRAYSLRENGDAAGAREALESAMQQYQRQGGVDGDAGAKVCRDQLKSLGSR